MLGYNYTKKHRKIVRALSSASVTVTASATNATDIRVLATYIPRGTCCWNIIFWIVNNSLKNSKESKLKISPNRHILILVNYNIC